MFVFLLALVAGAAVSFAQIGSNSKLAEDYIANGEDAFKKGQFALAAQNYSRALRAEDIEDKQVALLLYRRGEAHERAGKPAQAIADITSALYLPSLSASDRAKAYLARGRAYEAVGLSSQARSDIAKARSGGVDERDIARAPAPAQSASSGGSVPAFRTVSEDSVGSGRRSRQSAPSFATTSETAAPPPPSFQTSSRTTAPSRKERQQVAAFDTRSRTASGASEEEIPRFRTTIAPQDSATAAAAPETKEESSGRVGRFIGNLWSSATGDDKDDKEDAALAPPASSPAPQWSQSTREARKPAPSWSSQVATATPSAPPAPPPTAVKPAPATGGSGYRIQLAALKSDAEAQATWKRLKSRHGNLLQSYQPNIVKTELGGLGTFYRLQLGPFADKARSKQLCQNFKAGGLDCFLLAP